MINVLSCAQRWMVHLLNVLIIGSNPKHSTILKIIEGEMFVKDNIIFISPTFGHISFNDVLTQIITYMNEDLKSEYNIVVGTDSQNTNKTKMVLVICILRKGKGGKYFYYVENIAKVKDIRTKIYHETKVSLDCAKEINEYLYMNTEINYTFSIHADIGKNGESSKLINEIVGWVEAEGFHCDIKPNSYVASTIADRISK